MEEAETGSMYAPLYTEDMVPWPLTASRGAGTGAGGGAGRAWVAGEEGGLGGKLTTRGDARDRWEWTGRVVGSGRRGGELDAVK